MLCCSLFYSISKLQSHVGDKDLVYGNYLWDDPFGNSYEYRNYNNNEYEVLCVLLFWFGKNICSTNIGLLYSRNQCTCTGNCIYLGSGFSFPNFRIRLFLHHTLPPFQLFTSIPTFFILFSFRAEFFKTLFFFVHFCSSFSH